MQYYEVNFDGMPGLTHMYSGLSLGNLASVNNAGQNSSPKIGALQSLEKMSYMVKLGLKQAFIAPQKRPCLQALREKNYKGTDLEILTRVFEEDPKLFRDIFSSSSMWTANAATVSPSPDTQNQKLHLTVANLTTNFHRSLEAQSSFKYFQSIFAGANIEVHPALAANLKDEGAANHTRLANGYGKPGIELFVYGYSEDKANPTRKYPARQSLKACQQISLNHRLNPEHVVFAEQSAKAIDAGVFHNDVISTGNLNFFIYHEDAFTGSSRVIDELQRKFKLLSQENLQLIEVSNQDFSLEDAVKSYFFNSQIISHKDHMILIAPIECKNTSTVKHYIDKLIKNPNSAIKEVKYFDLTQSMQNGGGPACLRLRVVMNEEQIAATNPKIFFTDNLHHQLQTWIYDFYPEKLEIKMLIEPEYLKNIDEAYRKLSEILGLQLEY